VTDQRTSEPADAVVRRTTPSGADLTLSGDVVVKVHHPRTGAAALAARLDAVTRDHLAPYWVQPLDPRPHATPDGRWATAWPRVEVLLEDAGPHPWAEAGELLAALHRAGARAFTHTRSLPPQGGPARVERALARSGRAHHAAAPMLVDLGTRLLHEASTASRAADTVVHGDWHLGQVARTPDGLRLLDVDDLGVGDPAWDLARPAGFWAAGALDDEAWRTFLEAYRAASGPAVPADGDPWPRLDLPARCAVYVAAVRVVAVQPTHSADPANTLLEACARM